MLIRPWACLAGHRNHATRQNDAAAPRGVNAATRVWKMLCQRPGNPPAMLMMIHPPIAAMTSTATCGREACRTGGWTLWRISPLRLSPLAACSARGTCHQQRGIGGPGLAAVPGAPAHRQVAASEGVQQRSRDLGRALGVLMRGPGFASIRVRHRSSQPSRPSGAAGLLARPTGIAPGAGGESASAEPETATPRTAAARPSSSSACRPSRDDDNQAAA